MSTSTNDPRSITGDAAVGTFAPRPGGAPFTRMVAAQSRMEAKLLLRNGEQLLIAIVIPLLVLVGGVTAAKQLSARFSVAAVDLFTPGVLALAVLSTGFTSLAIATGFERRYGLIKRLGTSPLPRSGLLLGKAGAIVIVEVVQFVVIGAVGLMLGWRPSVGAAAVVGVVSTALVGTLACASWGLFIAGVLRAEATLAAANLIYLLLLAGGAVVLPATSYAGWGAVAQWLPSGALGEGMRDALLHGTVAWPALGALAVWAAVGAVLTGRTFRWE